MFGEHMPDIQGEQPPKSPELIQQFSYRVATEITQDLPPAFRDLGSREHLIPDNIGTIYDENTISKNLIVEGIKGQFAKESTDQPIEKSESNSSGKPPPDWICVSGYLHGLPKTVSKFGTEVGKTYRQWGAKVIGNRIDERIPEGEYGKYYAKTIVPVWLEGQEDVCEFWIFGLTQQEVASINENFHKPIEEKVDLTQSEGKNTQTAQILFEASIGTISSRDEDPAMKGIFKDIEEKLAHGEHPDSFRLLTRIRRRMLLNRLDWEEHVNGRDLYHTPAAEAQRKRIRKLLEDDKELRLSFTEAKDRVNQETIMDMALEAHHSEREKRQTAEMDALTDSLTGLPNRRSFDVRLQEEFSNAERLGTVLTFLEIDIDHFKGINDTYGHAMGDEVLKKVAEIIRRNIRRGDFAARIGGEEFALLMLSKEESDSEGIERLRKEVEESGDYPQGLRPTVSIGVATYPGDISNSNDLKERADAALYKAKEEGRNRVFRFVGMENGKAQFSKVEMSPRG